MNEQEKTSKPWGGRFAEVTDAFVERFTASIHFDKRLYHHDINGSIAHATMLAKAGVLTEDEKQAIIAGLDAIRADIDSGSFTNTADADGTDPNNQNVNDDDTLDTPLAQDPSIEIIKSA